MHKKRPGFSINTLKVSCLVFFLVLGSIIIKEGTWKEPQRIIGADVTSYYSYLPAVFIYNDLSMSFKDSLEGITVWTHPSPKGMPMLRMTSGLSFLYMPFFLASHAYALLTDYPANGYSAPYAFGLMMASAFYATLGLYLLGLLLGRYFTRLTIVLTLTALLFGTNLYIYTNDFGGYSHAYSFFLFSLFVYLVSKYYQKTTHLYSILLGCVLGLIVLIRPTNGIIALVFLLYDVYGIKQLKERVLLLISQYKNLLLLALGMFLILLPQLLYWKYIAGSFIHYSYEDEGFFFSDPKIWKTLFSYRKGWLLYTPLMTLALVGSLIVLFYKSLRQRYGLILMSFLPLNIYIIASWWCWWYGGSFGNRAFIESYAILGIPLAVMIDKIGMAKRLNTIAIVALLSGVLYLNQYQTWQYKIGLIHYADMTKEAYWDTFLTRHPSNYYTCLLAEPDYDLAKFEGKDTAYYNHCAGEISVDIKKLKEFKPQLFPAGDPSNIRIADDMFAMVYFGKVVNVNRMNISLSGDDVFLITYLKGSYEVAVDTLRNDAQSAALHIYEYELSEKVKFDDFDRIKITTLAGKNIQSIGHLLVYE
jgi:hypothetical protein